MWQHAGGWGVGIVSGRPVGRRDTEDDLDTVVVDLHPSNDGVNDLAFVQPVETVELLADSGGEVFQPADHEGHLTLGIGRVDGGLPLLVELRHSLLEPCDARLELGLLDRA